MRRPLLHFVALGAVCFVGHRLWAPAELVAAPATIVVTAAGDPSITEAQIDEEVLFREALARGLDHDRVVQARLVRLGRFLGLATDGDDARVEREARAMGLQRSDPVIRRHLVETMRIAAANLDSSDRPSEAEVAGYYRQHADRFEQPERLRFAHVYFSAERRGAAAAADASDVLAQLRRGAPADGGGSFGDPFVRGADLTLTSRQIADVFGADFAAALEAAPERNWSGPIRSVYGEHVVWVHERSAGAAAPYEAVRSRVVHELLHEIGDRKLRDTLQMLRAQYEVRVEPGAPRQVAAPSAHVCAEEF